MDTLFNNLLTEFQFPSIKDLDTFFETKQTFPYMDIERKDKTLTYKFALAGFSKDSIDATVKNGFLYLDAESKKKVEEGMQVLHNGISNRKVHLKVPLPFGDKFTKSEATFEDGILALSFDMDTTKESGLKLEIK